MGEGCRPAAAQKTDLEIPWSPLSNKVTDEPFFQSSVALYCGASHKLLWRALHIKEVGINKQYNCC